MRRAKLPMYVFMAPLLTLPWLIRETLCAVRVIGGKEGSDSIISEFGPEASGKDWKFDEKTPYAEVRPVLPLSVIIRLSHSTAC